MKINHVVLETSKKNFLKNISPTDLSKAGITLPENPESQFQLPIDKVRYYNVK